MDLCSIFGNALDNAIESAEKLEDPEKRQIKVYVYAQNQFVIIRFENFYDEAPQDVYKRQVLLYGAVCHGDKALEQLKYAFAVQSFTYFLWPLTAAVMAAATAAVIAEIVSREVTRRIEARQMAGRAEIDVYKRQGSQRSHQRRRR